MKKMRLFFKMLIMICFIEICCAPFTNFVYADDGTSVWDWVTDPIGSLSNLVEEILVEILLPFGDGVLYMVSSSVGELVTTDSIIFNNVKKLNINFWEDDSSSAVKGMMQEVVEKWYAVFFKIAVMVYMAVLVLAGIQILLHSTAQKTAQYKEYLVSWVTGVAILCLFPFAMKYIVKLSETAVKAVSMTVYTTTTARSPAILNDSEAAAETFGKEEFLNAMLDGDGTSTAISVEDINDSMLQTRALVQQNKKLILIAIYFILIGQMLVLLLMYYKRVFMIAFLITIFPLVAMTFAIDKMGDKKAQTFSIWFKEFVVNIVVQIFHAVVYVIVVNTAVQSYISSQGKNWLFMIISILFLFKGEKVLRSIFGVKSQANTLGDLAATAATYTAMTSMFKSSGSSTPATARDTADAEVIKNNNKSRANWKSTSPSSTGGSAGGTTGGSSGNAKSSGQKTGDDPAGVDTSGYDMGAAMDKVAGGAMKHRLKNGIASGLAKRGVSAAGRVVGATYGLSKGNADGKMASNVAASSLAGSKMAKGATAPITSAINKVEREVHGRKMASDIRLGLEDEALGLNVPEAALLPPDVDPDEIVGKNGESMQQIYREALAAMATATARGGKAKGEVAFWNYVQKNTKK